MPSRRPDQPVAPQSEPREGERIAKLLARAGIASRREIERMIAEGRIARDGVVIDTPATVLRSIHGITVDGNPVAAPPPARLFAYHKPAGLLVTERDPKGRATIYDRLPAGLPRVVPVGRLDLGTEGLLLLTTDGELKRQLELPATGVERTYRARAYGPVSQARLEELIDGIEIDGVRYGSIDANLERRTGANTWIELTLTEGKNREVRRVLEHLGLEVSRLIRTRYGPFVLADMPPGAVGEIRQHDLVAFRQSLKRGKGGDRDMRVMATPLPQAAPQETATAPSARTFKSRPTQTHPGEGSRPPAAGGGAGGDSSREPRKSFGARAVPGDLQQRDDRVPRGRGSSGGRSDPKIRADLARTREERPMQGRSAEKTTRPTLAPDQSGRPARPQRKPGWARAKPRSGPGRPKK